MTLDARPARAIMRAWPPRMDGRRISWRQTRWNHVRRAHLLAPGHHVLRMGRAQSVEQAAQAAGGELRAAARHTGGAARTRLRAVDHGKLGAEYQPDGGQ